VRCATAAREQAHGHDDRGKSEGGPLVRSLDGPLVRGLKPSYEGERAGMSRPATLGQLRESGWVSRPVKDEIRRNAIDRIAAGKPVVDGLVGYEDTVLPQLENALLAGHDVIMLGERGQAKTRIIRSLVELLDESTPVVAGSEVNDDPYAPISRHARDLIAEKGDDTPIEWITRDRRFGEKLATPDTSIADLIGEVDPIKVAEGRYLADEMTIHYGLVPRTNRGVFAINELPDLAERIQVGLLNVLEERDVQIRGYKIRLPLDLMLVASANPEDYTNRGRIITPLKDRFGSQIRTHYPLDAQTEMAVVAQELDPLDIDGLRIEVPSYMSEIVAEISQLARRSPHINQRSGVSVRLSIANQEVLVANAMRRALRAGEKEVVPRVSDLESLAASTAGKVEIESLDDGREEHVVERIVKGAVLEVFKARCRPERFRDVLTSFEGGLVIHTGEDVPAQQYVEQVANLAGMRELLSDLGVGETPAGIASAAEFVLEGLHLSKRLNKDASGGRATYRGRG
jgi:magnesium chelatase subunit I